MTFSFTDNGYVNIITQWISVTQFKKENEEKIVPLVKRKQYYISVLMSVCVSFYLSVYTMNEVS